MIVDKVAIFLTGYNAQDTIRASIESVLNQTYSNFNFYVCDNGSNDNTWDIIKEYTEKDKRIFATRLKRNFYGSLMHTFYWLFDSQNIQYTPFQRNEAEDWVSFIDADDTYSFDYLEKMLNFAKKNSLDLAICGWDFVRPNEIDIRSLENDMIIEKKDFSDLLPIYDKFMGPLWNKLVSYKLFAQHIDYFEYEHAKLFTEGVFSYGADTCFNYILLSCLEKFGILSESLYKYNIFDNSVSRKKFEPMRIVSDRWLAKCRFDFLHRIGSDISKTNRDFILNIYHKSTMATINLINKSDLEPMDRLKYLYEIFKSEYMKQSFE